MNLTGSIARASFRDAGELLATSGKVPARTRVPFDYSVEPGGGMVTRWDPPRALLPSDATGPIVEAMRALRRRERSVADLVEESIDRLAVATELGGVVATCDDARRRADALDAELAAGLDRGPLHGIPITVKDVIDVAGVATRAGSDAYDDVPFEDAIAVARLEAAGAIVVAKASTHEFALGVTSPQSRNPRDPTRIPGGSSGGSVVCVVTGAGLGSLGTDTRASIRVPAALSGAVGLKPTYGRIPTEGVLTLSWTMDHVAPLAMSVTDAALMLDAMLGGASRLAWTPNRGLDGTRIGLVTAGLDGASAAVTSCFEQAVAALYHAGCAVKETGSPNSTDLALANAAGLVVSRCEAASAHKALGLDRSLYWEEVRDQLDAADGITAVDYLDAQRVRAELRERMRACFLDHDLLVMPTAPVVAPPAEDFADYLMLLARNAIPWSLVGFPAISVPIGTAGDLPVGMQLVAPPDGEARLVEVSRALERR
jgi:aspartyl-tRNA(Asn)/glutamyl-tRNA(Gln) amidotransferase subunit A